MDMGKKERYIGTLSALTALCFSLGWIGIYQAIAVSKDGGWWLPIVWFSLGISLSCLAVLSSRWKFGPLAFSLIAFLPSLFFGWDIFFLLIGAVGAALCFLGFVRMRDDLDSNIRIRIRRSMQHGLGWIVFSFSLVVASFYYNQIRSASGEDLLQRLSINQASHAMLTQALGLINPDFRKADQRQVTVDEFLLSFQDASSSKNETVVQEPSDEELLQMAGISASDPRAPQVLRQIRKGLEQNAVVVDTRTLVLRQSRTQLSDIAGVPLSGREPITDVLSGIVDQRLRSYFKPDTTEGSATLLPFILSVFLFLTLWSLGAILSFFWRFLTAGAFALLRRWSVIEVKAVMVEQEVVVH